MGSKNPKKELKCTKYLGSRKTVDEIAKEF